MLIFGKIFKMKKVTFCLLLSIFVVSCAQKAPKINDEFRNSVINKLQLGGDSLAVYNAFLDQLDAKNVSFGGYYIKTHREIQDSCHSVLAAKYEKDHFVYRRYTDEDSEFLYTITKQAIDNYYKKIAVDTSKMYLVEYITNSTPEIKRYLNAAYGLKLFIPEDDLQDAVSE